jgi:hypothetical protein
LETNTNGDAAASRCKPAQRPKLDPLKGCVLGVPFLTELPGLGLALSRLFLQLRSLSDIFATGAAYLSSHLGTPGRVSGLRQKSCLIRIDF